MNSPNLQELTRYAQTNNPKLIGQVQNFLARSDIRAMKGIQRLALVCENFQQLSYEQAYRVIDPDAFQDEFEDVQSYKGLIKTLNILRICLSLAPLILTWFALFSATSAYQNDLAKYPNDQTVTFLRLWQEGFHHTTAFTFSTTAIIDVILLCSFLICSVLITLLEYQARRNAHLFADDLRSITSGVLKAVINEGISQTTKQADIDKIVKAVRVALDGAFTNTAGVVQKALDMVVKSNESVEQLFSKQVQPMFTRFDQNVTSFQQEVHKLTQETRTLTTSSTAMATASTAMATASTGMASSATQMTTSVNDLKGSTQQIDAHLVKLDQTENTMVTRIEAAQQRVAGEVSRAATSMNGAAATVAGSAREMTQASDQVEQVGKTLATLDKKSVQQITDSTTKLAGLIQQLNSDIQITINAMRRMTGQPRNIFQWVTQSLAGKGATKVGP